MNTSIRRLASTLALGATLALAAGQVQSAVMIDEDNTSPINIPGLTSFATTGAMMSGMSVSASFSSGTSQTLSWGTTGADSGGVMGIGWGLSLTGDSFVNNWLFTIDADAGLGQLVTLVLEGIPGLTVFDRTDPSFGTDGSAQGLDFAFVDDTIDATVTYSRPVGIGGNAPVGDLFHVLTVEFSQSGPRTTFSFVQDTDNDSRVIPEPASLALVGLGLVGLAAARRHARRA